MLLQNQNGETYARLEPVPSGETLQALALIWTNPPVSLPPPTEARPEFSRLLEELRARGARGFDMRIITSQIGIAPETTRERSDWQRSILSDIGFTFCGARLEFKVPLEDAIKNLEANASPPRLTWIPVATAPGEQIERAADVLRAAGAGDPDHDPDDDALGFLLARREDDTLALPPEALQIGVLDGQDAAILVASVQPTTGWCSLYYMGVVPAFRGRGFGAETMLRGFSTMRGLGGVEYHDGTSATNHATLALFRRIGAKPYRDMEQWRFHG